MFRFGFLIASHCSHDLFALHCKGMFQLICQRGANALIHAVHIRLDLLSKIAFASDLTRFSSHFARAQFCRMSQLQASPAFVAIEASGAQAQPFLHSGLMLVLVAHSAMAVSYGYSKDQNRVARGLACQPCC